MGLHVLPAKKYFLVLFSALGLKPVTFLLDMVVTMLWNRSTCQKNRYLVPDLGTLYFCNVHVHFA
jgi:hypothetical protein